MPIAVACAPFMDIREGGTFMKGLFVPKILVEVGG